MKKLLSTLLALIMLITTLTATGVNAFASTYSGWCGANAKWSLNTSSGTLTISGSGDMYAYDYDRPWDNYADYIKHIRVENGITRIADDSFSWMFDIKTIFISDTVQSIGKMAFFECGSQLNSLIIGSGVKTIDEYAFACNGISSLVIPESVTTIGDSAFACCNYLKTVTIPSSVTSLKSSSFGGCKNLTAINVPSSNKKYLSKDGILFNKSKTILMTVPLGKKLTSYTVPSTVETIADGAFCANCGVGDYWSAGYGKTLKKVVIPNSVTKIGAYAFDGCEVLATLSLSKKIKSIGKYAFSSNYALKTVELPNTLTSVGTGAFYNCKNITKLVLSTSMKKIPSDFAEGCKNLKSIFIPSGITSIASNSLGRYWGNNGEATVKNFKIYSKGNKAAINYAKKYSGIAHVKVSVPKLAFKSVTAVSKGFKASWTKNTKMDGYQIQYATDSKFTKNKKTVTESDEKKASKTIKNLTAKKKYYVRVRNYKRYAGAQVFSAWSGTKSVITKK